MNAHMCLPSLAIGDIEIRSKRAGKIWMMKHKLGGAGNEALFGLIKPVYDV